jgi:hypothetical protein
LAIVSVCPLWVIVHSRSQLKGAPLMVVLVVGRPAFAVAGSDESLVGPLASASTRLQCPERSGLRCASPDIGKRSAALRKLIAIAGDDGQFTYGRDGQRDSSTLRGSFTHGGEGLFRTRRAKIVRLAARNPDDQTV